jgi:hypothetical protein
VKILFFGRHFTYFRNFESVLRGLAERGHHIHLAADRDEFVGGQHLVETLASTYPGLITYATRRLAPTTMTPGWRVTCVSVSTTCATSIESSIRR